MTITLIPTRTDTLEPVKVAYRALLVADLPAALGIVTERAAARGEPFINLTDPTGIITYELNTIRSFAVVQAWPTVTVTGWNLRVDRAAQQPGGWEQTLAAIEFQVFAQHTDATLLALALDRWGEAVKLVLRNAPPMVGGTRRLRGEDALLTGAPSGQTPYNRMISYQTTVRLRS